MTNELKLPEGDLNALHQLRAAHEVVAAGLAYTRANFSATPTGFVGHIPAVEYEAALDVVVAGLGMLLGVES